MTEKTSGRGRRIAKAIAVIPAALIVILYFLYPMGVGIFAVIPAREDSGSPPEGFTAVELSASDEAKLAGWYTPGTNGIGILVLHGSRSNRNALRAHISMLAKNGYAVLALDMRGHGASGGKANAFGWQSTSDVRGALDYLLKQPGIKKAGALGLSMGGEALLSAASDCPELTAIVSEGASHRCMGDYLSLPENRGFMHSWTARVLYFTVGTLTGCREPKPIAESIASAPGAALLLIASGGSKKEIDYNTMYAKTAGDRAELWIADGASHTGALAAYPNDYEQRVVAFFQKIMS